MVIGQTPATLSITIWINYDSSKLSIKLSVRRKVFTLGEVSDTHSDCNWMHILFRDLNYVQKFKWWMNCHFSTHFDMLDKLLYTVYKNNVQRCDDGSNSKPSQQLETSRNGRKKVKEKERETEARQIKSVMCCTYIYINSFVFSCVNVKRWRTVWSDSVSCFMFCH